MTATAVRFETLIERYHDEIYSYLWRVLNSSGGPEPALEAQDLTQEVYLRAYRAFGRLRKDSNHRAWLYKIATNRAYTALKRGKRRGQRTVDLPDGPDGMDRIAAGEAHSPEQRVIAGERRDRLRREIATLPPKQQASVVMRHLQGLDYSGIALALDCSQDGARANVYQGLRRLRQSLASELGEAQDV
jgi:RNA polymerase sigma-70 factor (ECF subfamily)